MLGHYTKSALKQFEANRAFAAINIIGLALGLAAFMLIALFVKYEFSYESGFENTDRIYRISRDYYATGESSAARPSGMPGPAATLLKQDFAQVRQSARLFCCGAVVKSEEGSAIIEGGYAMADNELFEIFDFEWISGDPATALMEPYTVVLTRSAAERHFGAEDPMGQVILYGGGQQWQSARITGVIEDLPANTHLKFDFLESNQVWTDCRCEEQEQSTAYFNNWANDIFYTYVLLEDGADAAALEEGADAFFERHLEEGAGARTGFTATPVSDIHLRSDRDSELWLSGNDAPEVGLASLYTFSAVAVFILLLVCINFMNLSSARALSRAREVGVRKVAGADRGQIFVQFMVESFCLVLFSALLATALVEYLLPSFSAFLVRELIFGFAEDLELLLWLVILVALTAAIAGSYPSFYLSRFSPGRVLKGNAWHGRGASSLRRLLVILQFAIAIALMCCTAVVHEQLGFLMDQDPGYDRQGVAILSPSNVEGEQWQNLRQRWSSHPGIDSVTSSNLVPLQNNPLTASLRDLQSRDAAVRMPFLQVDYSFFETYRIQLVAGRYFSMDFASDRYVPAEEGGLGTQPFILSLSAARELGWSAGEAIGKELEFSGVQGARFNVEEARGMVVGVVDDLRFESLHSSLRPIVYTIPGNAQRFISVRLNGSDTRETMGFLRDTWRELRPDLPSTLELLEQRVSTAYQREERQRSILTFFACLAVLIACLGLLGLALHSSATRIREIGLRKTMGSSSWRIVWLLSADFSKLVLLSNLLAWPFAYFVMAKWLENFAYRIDLTPLAFIGSGMLALCVAWVTVGGTAARAANCKPVLALRYE